MDKQIGQRAVWGHKRGFMQQAVDRNESGTTTAPEMMLVLDCIHVVVDHVVCCIV